VNPRTIKTAIPTHKTINCVRFIASPLTQRRWTLGLFVICWPLENKSKDSKQQSTGRPTRRVRRLNKLERQESKYLTLSRPYLSR
ncbi:MAG TPA: hypothetical protein VMW24_27610, partial [Sedimentisphaerales bacterium]|nr:hypothetical protein [Sedimentisphaerales bacterium]